MSECEGGGDNDNITVSVLHVHVEINVNVREKLSKQCAYTQSMLVWCCVLGQLGLMVCIFVKNENLGLFGVS